MDIKAAIAQFKKENPYPETVFTKPSAKEFQTINRVLRENDLYPDGYSGWFGRIVWNSCIKRLEEMIETE